MQPCGSSAVDPVVSSSSGELVNFDIPCEEYSVEQFAYSEETLTCYSAGWVARKSDICKACQEVLTKVDVEHSYACRPDDVFASKKWYSSACSVGLVPPCAEMCAQVHAMEELFRIHFVEVCRSGGVAQRLCDTIFPKLNYSFIFSARPQHALYLSQKITKLYIVMRLFYAVKLVNRDIAATRPNAKRKDTHSSEESRKMQTILHK